MQDPITDAFRITYLQFGVLGLFFLAFILSAFFIGRYALFKWVDNGFQQRLEEYKIQAQTASEQQKHDLQKIMEDKKYEINSRFDRTTRINHLEFQMLPELWGKLNETIMKSQSLFGLRQYLDVRRLSEDKLLRHMIDRKFTENQIESVISSGDRPKAYQSIIDALDFSEASSAFNEYATMLRKASIFIRPDLFIDFKDFESIIKSALIEYDMNREGFFERRSYEHSMKLGDAAGIPLSSFEDKIRNRLWNATEPAIN